MRYLLDTNICIYIAKRRPPEVAGRFERLYPGEVGMSMITYGELLLGAQKSQHPEQTAQRLALRRACAGTGSARGKPMALRPHPSGTRTRRHTDWCERSLDRGTCFGVRSDSRQQQFAGVRTGIGASDGELGALMRKPLLGDVRQANGCRHNTLPKPKRLLAEPCSVLMHEEKAALSYATCRPTASRESRASSRAGGCRPARSDAPERGGAWPSSPARRLGFRA